MKMTTDPLSSESHTPITASPTSTSSHPQHTPLHNQLNNSIPSTAATTPKSTTCETTVVPNQLISSTKPFATATTGSLTSSSSSTAQRRDYEATPAGDSFVPSLATVLTHLVSLSPAERGQITRFHAVKAPDITIRDYLERIQKYFGCSNECFVLSLIYIDRIVKIHQDFTVSILNIHRLLITSVMLAAKFFDDVYYSNAFYARVGGVRTKEINLLEWQFLSLVNYHLYVTPREYDQYLKNVLAAVNAGIQRPLLPPIAAQSSTPPPSTTVLSQQHTNPTINDDSARSHSSNHDSTRHYRSAHHRHPESTHHSTLSSDAYALRSGTFDNNNTRCSNEVDNETHQPQLQQQITPPPQQHTSHHQLLHHQRQHPASQVTQFPQQQHVSPVITDQHISSAYEFSSRPSSEGLTTSSDTTTIPSTTAAALPYNNQGTSSQQSVPSDLVACVRGNSNRNHYTINQQQQQQQQHSVTRQPAAQPAITSTSSTPSSGHPCASSSGDCQSSDLRTTTTSSSSSQPDINQHPSSCASSQQHPFSNGGQSSNSVDKHHRIATSRSSNMGIDATTTAPPSLREDINHSHYLHEMNSQYDSHHHVHLRDEPSSGSVTKLSPSSVSSSSMLLDHSSLHHHYRAQEAVTMINNHS